MPFKRYEIIISLLGTFILTAFAFSRHTAAGIFVLLTSVFFLLLFFLFLFLRDKKIKKLASELERILHNQEKTLIIKNSNEGAIAILESEIHKMTARLSEQSDRLKKDKITLQEAIADIFHQVRTPLTAINIAVSRLSKEEISYETRLDILRDIKKQIERNKWLTETLLKMSKIDAGTAQFRAEPVRVRQLIDKAIQPLLIPLELGDIDLVVEVDNETFTGDIDWTAEAITNIVKNAVEHFMRVGFQKDAPRHVIHIRANETPLFTQIVISDNGGGFPEEDIPRLFERYFTSSNSSPNSIGIGLSLCRMIIVSQNGTIKAENTGEGASFHIKFYKGVI
ncbi:MAG: HAMP domain-containing sensor histidine kinase [Bacillota bacterium]|nr:HAMP domain-containing sensor histidine kinase [Bacillota bacterium]